VVFPAAEVKLYLDASAEERARRRANDPSHSGGPAALAEVANLLTERDRSDSTRAASPLYAAPDATVIDTTGAPIDQVVARVMSIVESKLAS
jgi:cytidylate kinase